MRSTRLIHLMMAALSVTAVTGVAWLDNQHAGAGQLAVRADDDLISIGPDVGSGGDADADADSSSDAPPAADKTTSSDDADATTSAPPQETTSEDPPTTSDDPTPTPSSSDSPPTPTTTNDTPTPTKGTTTTPPPNTSPTSSSASGPSETSSNNSNDNNNDDNSTTNVPQTTPPPVTSTFVTVITSTDGAGQTHISSSSSVIISTPSPVAAEPEQDESMTSEVKRTIIGVCVGVGGAIVLAAAGVLFWRLRSKKRSQEENEELVSYGDGFGGPGTAEKSEPSGSVAGRSPFQSTLESYHAPTQTNAASNF
ncbi:hypothetical protein F5Y11DRAFT_216324 [Daldinia sp. FL1419]|nr:hypothetical protein F5Y11DRAFT_216324 [Daldinia sp. FL1419]